MPYFLWLLTALSTLAALLCAIFAWDCSKIRVPRRQIDRIDLRLVDLEDRHAELHKTVTKLRSRVGMREARAKLAENEETPQAAVEIGPQLPGESSADWKARMRLAIAKRNAG